MIIGTFLFYFILFAVIFTYPGFRSSNSNAKYKLLLIPALFGLVMVFLTVIKVFIIYKILALFVMLLTLGLSYWQWGEQIRKFWR
ncbi:hypothetical protein Desor_3334 [Desulfosporosinus orientis DSM 765]|uniref:Uncharacterized protein n=1 Tax=Desulfosporosinus orientis (strain ATCC 19365 / DSM 765 / NCIMB 8382 / VKM B-1628 / Singapore I) TaxID=768706 RepID=G7WDS5_DESOD|nr:hypothetical protein [Desulfosporosinus orientis]AET68832.1 hypothetical protein Desor_3334 [Desulfosporosinus orientis DSM 765]